MTQRGELQPFQAMTRGPFAALLSVPEDGFTWRYELVATDIKGDDKNIAGPWLVKTDSLYARQYSPLAISNLHRRFVRIEPTKESVLPFANEFGFLGHALWLHDPGVNQQVLLVGESLGFWRRQIEHMARLIVLWELVRHGRRRELNQLVQWSPQGKPQQVRLYLVSVNKELKPDLAEWMQKNPGEFHDHFRRVGEHPERITFRQMTVLANEEVGHDVELLERWKRGDPIEPVRYFVHREVNKHLRGHVSPAVLPFRKGDIYFFPDCLLRSLYTLFMLELSGRGRPAILCKRPNCGKYFEPKHGRQEYCDKSCQKLAYYYRNKKSKTAK